MRLIEKIKKYFEERKRLQEFEQQLDAQLTDPTFLDRVAAGE